VRHRLQPHVLHYDENDTVSCQVCMCQIPLSEAFVFDPLTILTPEGLRLWSERRWWNIYNLRHVYTMDDLGTVAAGVLQPSMVALLLVLREGKWGLPYRKDLLRRLTHAMQMSRTFTACRLCLFSRMREDWASLAEEVRERGGRVRSFTDLMADVLADEAFPSWAYGAHVVNKVLASQVLSRSEHIATKYLHRRWPPGPAPANETN
jgi:hypothetical protein